MKTGAMSFTILKGVGETTKASGHRLLGACPSTQWSNKKRLEQPIVFCVGDTHFES